MTPQRAKVYHPEAELSSSKRRIFPKKIKAKKHLLYFGIYDRISLRDYQALIHIFISEGGDIMAYKISDECIKCGACAAECPVSAISEGDDKYVIDPDTCISCGNCEATCPVGAPKED